MGFLLKTCKAFQPLAGTRKGWVPCVREAETGSVFCKRHGDAVFGAMLGALVYAEPVDEREHLCTDDEPCSLDQALRRN